LLTEIRRKYVGDDDGEDEVKASDSRWEFIQMEKVHKLQRNIFKLKCIVLANTSVSHASPSSSSFSENLFSCCVELDLTNARVSEWKKLEGILRLFPQLKTLYLSGNKLEKLDDSSQCQPSSPLVQLSLNRCSLSQSTADLIPSLFPQLEELYLAFNDLRTFSPIGECKELRKIDLQGNPIGSFSAIDSLAKLPMLEFLNLSNCGLERIKFENGSEKEIGYARLNTIFLQYNSICDWESINELARLPSLTKLVLKGSLLPGSKGMDSREMIIASMPLLLDLDRCDISQTSRRSSELLFLSRFGIRPVEEVHARTIARLEELYGAVEQPVDGKVGRVGGVQSIRLQLVCGDLLVERDLSLLLSIHKIVGIAARLFNFDPDDVLAVELRRRDFPPERLQRTKDNLLRQFDMEGGDAIAFLLEK